MATTISNLTATQTQLQASYRLITAETSLSLVNFLPATANSLYCSFFVNLYCIIPSSSQKAGRQPDPKVRHHGPRISQHQHRRDGRAPVPEIHPATAIDHPEANLDGLSASPTRPMTALPMQSLKVSDRGRRADQREPTTRYRDGLLSTTQSGLNDVSNTMASMRDVLVNFSNDSVQATSGQTTHTQYASML